jgi:hypothetical protein
MRYEDCLYENINQNLQNFRIEQNFNRKERKVNGVCMLSESYFLRAAPLVLGDLVLKPASATFSF